MEMYSSGAQGFKNLSVFASSALIALICLFLSVRGASAQGGASNSGSSHESARAAQVRALNNSVLQLHGQMQEHGASVAGIHSQAAVVLAQRAAALQTLIQENPHAALTFAFSPDLLADLAAKFPASAAVLENHVTLSGTFEHWVADSADMKSSKESWFLNTGANKLSLYFATTQRSGPSSGPSVTIEGVQLGSKVAVSKVSAPLPGPSGIFNQVIIPPAVRGLEGSVLGARNLLFVLALVVALLAVLKIHRHSSPSATWCLPFLLRRFAVIAVALLVTIYSPLTASAQTCSTTGAQNIAVILVTFPSTTLPSGVTVQSLSDDFFGTSTGVSLDGFLRDASNGQTWATGNVFGPYTLTGTYTTCADLDGAILNDALAAAIGGGANLLNYNRVFLAFPDIFGCGWAGYTSNACSITSTSGNFNASMTYVAVRYLETRAPAVSLIAHELGHNLGLLHSGIVTAGSDVLGPVSSPGTYYDQNGDYWSVMGEMVLGMYPSAQKAEVLGWLSQGTNYQVVQNSGTYTLQPLETSPAGLQALKIQRGTGNNAWLWVEYRQPVDSYDSTLSTQPFSGALIHYEDSNTQLGHTYLPNFTPADTSWNSPALGSGQTWSDPYSNLSISVLSATSSGLTVSVNYGATSCTASAPTVVASPLNPSVYAGQSANYSVSLTNNDSSACSSSTINLTSSEPSGWSTSFSSSSVTLSPGQSTNVTMGKGAPSGIPAGTYAVNITASNNSATAGDTANATVVTSPSLTASVSVAGTSFTRPGSVPITATVTNGGIAASGASVAFTLTAPNGATSTQAVTTGANGTASWNYKLSSKSQAGNYSVAFQARLSSGSKRAANTITASSNIATFSVQ